MALGPAFSEVSPLRATAPLVLSSPHSGTDYPAELLGNLRVPAHQLRCFEDGPTDSIATAAAAEGASVITARYARAYVDLNRDPRELDPSLVRGGPVVRELRPSARVLAGLGVVPSRVAGVPIYARPLTPEEFETRLAQGYEPYHRRLAELLDETAQRHGSVLLIDCHSMPNEVAAAAGNGSIDVAVGDRYASSCDPGIVVAIEEELRTAGLRHDRNRPYAGGHITELHGFPAAGRNAIQLEFRRGLFMDERSGHPHEGIADLCALMRRIVRTVSQRLLAVGIAAQ